MTKVAADQRLAVDGGTPVRTAPLPTGFIGTRLVGEEEEREVVAALRSRALSRVSGMTAPTRVVDFEREVCRRIKSPYALAVTSGTAALEVGLAGLGIGPGDEVIMPALNFISSPEAVLRLGGVPVFAEVDEGFGLDPDDLEQRITPRTRAIMPVHIHGAACQITGVMEVARRHGLLVQENGAWSFGATYQGQSVGTFGNVGAFSLQSVKVITAGEGGIVCTADPVVYERAMRYHDHGNFRGVGIPRSLLDAEHALEGATPELLPLSVEPFVGAAYRMNEITGALALAQVRKIDAVLGATQRAQRAMLAGLRAVMKELVSPVFTLREVPDPDGDCGIAVGLLFSSRELTERFRAALAAEGVPNGPLYGGRPVYALPQLQSLRPVWTNGTPLLRGPAPEYREGLCPRTEQLMSRSVVISVTPGYSDADAADVVAATAKVARALA